MEKELFKLSWLSWVTLHSPWEASRIKTFKTNRCIIVTEYHILPEKLFFFEYVIILVGKLEIFWYTATSLTPVLLKHRFTKQSFKKSKKLGWEYLKTWVGIFRGNSPGGSLIGGDFPGENFPAGSFTDTN